MLKYRQSVAPSDTPARTESLRLSREALQQLWAAGAVASGDYQVLSAQADSVCSRIAEEHLNAASVSAEKAGLECVDAFELKGVERVIQIVEHGGVFYVSTGRTVRSFNGSGRELAPLELNQGRYVGLFPEENRRLWIADAEGKALRALSWQGEQEAYVPLAGIKGVDPEVVTPCYGFWRDGEIWLLATRDLSLEATYMRKIYKISPESWTAEEIPTPSGHSLAMLSDIGGSPALLSNSPGTLFSHSETGQEWKPLFHNILPHYARAVVGLQGRHIIGMGNYIAISDRESGISLAVNLFRQFGISDPVLGTSGESLLVAPKHQPKIYLFKYSNDLR